MTDKISLVKQIFIQKIVCGLAWMVTGVSMVFDSMASKIVGCVALAIIIAVMSYVRFAKKEQEDEMAKNHMNLAKAKVLDYVMMVAMIIGILSLVVEIRFDFRNVVYFVVGAVELIIGMTFLHYEKVGE